MPTSKTRANDYDNANAAHKRIISDDDLLRMWRDDAMPIPTLSPEESAALCLRAQAGDMDARNRCVEGNLKLVPWVIEHYKFTKYSTPTPDLIQDGNIGLMRAVMGYKAGIGKFSSYAVRTIWSHLMREVNQDRTIHLPEHTRLRLTAEARGQLLKGHPKLTDGITEAAHRTRFVDSLDREIFLDTDGPPVTLGDTIPDPDEDTEGVAVAKIDREELHALLASVLSPRRHLILALQFGLDGKEPRDLAAIGRLLGISRERTRQLRDQALKDLADKLALDPDGGVALKSILRHVMKRAA